MQQPGLGQLDGIMQQSQCRHQTNYSIDPISCIHLQLSQRAKESAGLEEVQRERLNLVEIRKILASLLLLLLQSRWPRVGPCSKALACHALLHQSCMTFLQI